jgi:hypothetical protein
MLKSLEQMSSGARSVLAPCQAASVAALPTSSLVCGQQREMASSFAVSGRSARGHVLCGRAPFSRALPTRRARQSKRRGALESMAQHGDAKVVTLFDVELPRGFESNPRQPARRRRTLCVRQLLRS